MFLSAKDKEKEKVTAERKRFGLKSNEGKSSSTGSAIDVSVQNTIKQLRAQNKKQKRKIKALKRKSTVPESGDGDKDSDADAGDQFGGKISKRKSKH